MLTVATKGMKGGHRGSEGNEGSYDADILYLAIVVWSIIQDDYSGY